MFDLPPHEEFSEMGKSKGRRRGKEEREGWREGGRRRGRDRGREEGKGEREGDFSKVDNTKQVVLLQIKIISPSTSKSAPKFMRRNGPLSSSFLYLSLKARWT